MSDCRAMRNLRLRVRLAFMDKRKEDEKREKIPAAGPHAKPELTNPDATPGTGMLPPIDDDDPNVQPSS